MVNLRLWHSFENQKLQAFSNLFWFKLILAPKSKLLFAIVCKKFNVKLPLVVITYPVFLSISELRFANAHTIAWVFDGAVWLGNRLLLLIISRMVSQ